MKGSSHTRTYVLTRAKAEHMDQYRCDLRMEMVACLWSHNLPACGTEVANPDPQSLQREGN
jgi:hypothetical protein